MLKTNYGILLALAAFILFLVTPGAALADEGEGGMEAEINGYHVRLIFPTAAASGVNEFHVQISRADGSAVSDAQVEISAQPIEKTEQHETGMEEPETAAPSNPHGGMSGMSGMETAQPAPHVEPAHDEPEEEGHGSGSIKTILLPGHDAGEYAGEISFKQAGHWMLVVHFTVNGETQEVEFPLDVASSGPSPQAVLAGFFGINAAIIGAAALPRRKPTLA